MRVDWIQGPSSTDGICIQEVQDRQGGSGGMGREPPEESILATLYNLISPLGKFSWEYHFKHLHASIGYVQSGMYPLR